MDTNAVRQEVEMTYKKVKSLAGWTVDENIVLTITSCYVTFDREFDAESLNRAMDALKKRAGWFSPLRGNLLPLMSAFLDKPGMNIEEEIDRLFAKQRILRNFGFRNTAHSYLAALFMTDDANFYDKEAKQAKSLYDEIKKQHFFLTSDDDYAYAVLLGKNGSDPVEHADSMRTYYNALRATGFRAGNELQWMSQVITYRCVDFNPSLVLRAVEILERFSRDTRIRPIHYPMIGFLVAFKVTDCALLAIVELSHSLGESKPFKRQKEMALSIAIGYVLHDLIEIMEENVDLATSVELILQTQQAIMSATIAAISASSTASS